MIIDLLNKLKFRSLPRWHVLKLWVVVTHNWQNATVSFTDGPVGVPLIAREEKVLYKTNPHIALVWFYECKWNTPFNGLLRSELYHQNIMIPFFLGV